MIAALVGAIGVVILSFFYWQKKQNARAHELANLLLAQAENKANHAVDAAHLQAKEIVLKAEQKAYLVQQEHSKTERALTQKEQLLAQEKQTLHQKLQEIQKKEKALHEREVKLTSEEQLFLSKLALTPEQARDELLKQAKEETDKECQLYYLHKKQEFATRVDQTTSQLIVTALSRLPHKALKDATLCEVILPNEEMKAKIIGREGKNIKAFQQLTGVTVVIDDTPLTLTLSCFDAQRREIAKIALEGLIQDGRITTARIEEEVQAAEKKLASRLVEYGQQAALSCHIHGLHPELLVHLGKLKLRTSFGQNLLDHSVEVATIMGLLAAELKLSVPKAVRMGLLHDIGKAITTDTPLSHALSGYRLCLENAETEEIANGVGCHHDEMPAATLEAMLVKCADYLSGARVGVRAENGEIFLKRLHDFESVATSFTGVKSAFALSAGRELQVFVRPEVVTEADALSLAKDIAKKIQPLVANLRVQVTVIRETKSVEYSS